MSFSRAPLTSPPTTRPEPHGFCKPNTNTRVRQPLCLLSRTPEGPVPPHTMGQRMCRYGAGATQETDVRSVYPSCLLGGWSLRVCWHALSLLCRQAPREGRRLSELGPPSPAPTLTRRGPRDTATAVVSCAAVALVTTQATWTSLAGAQTPHRAMVRGPRLAEVWLSQSR